jgi:aryl-alcohol dehydrogenase-like predicted oxidoreductase
MDNSNIGGMVTQKARPRQRKPPRALTPGNAVKGLALGGRLVASIGGRSAFDSIGRTWLQLRCTGAGRGHLLALRPMTSTARTRELAGTGAQVLPISLGGEGILRTTGRSRAAVPVILEALRLGVRYCDTAPAYQQSQDYYGEAFRVAGSGSRGGVMLASKCHERTRDRALRLLDDSLRRLGTDHLDTWQMHDLRDMAELDVLLGPSGALQAALEAKSDGRIRFIGVTGHHDPEVLLAAMRRFPFDTVLLPTNPADGRHRPFLPTVLVEARKRHMGVVGMKALAAGQLLEVAAAAELLRYAATHADTVVVGCSSVAEVRENLAVAAAFTPMPEREQRALEGRVAPRASAYDYFKG